MVRKLAILGCITLLALVVGCAGSSSTASHASGSGSRGKVSAITAVSSASPCPAAGTKKFSRALFVTDAGLAAGAFRQWIYVPAQLGAFSKGVPTRPESVAKATAAGEFVLTRLQEAKASAQSDPALCRGTIGAIDKLTSTVRGMVATTKKGVITPSEVMGTAALLSRLQTASAGAGVAFKAQHVASLPSSD
jgi:hypothetical protein